MSKDHLRVKEIHNQVRLFSCNYFESIRRKDLLNPCAVRANKTPVRRYRNQAVVKSLLV
jgi:hypothetical protein